VELEPVPVTVHDVELLELALPEVVFRVRCSSGTYVRALARDLGEALGTGAHLTELRRTRVGGWSVEGSVEGDLADGIPDDAWISPLEALADWPRVALGDEEAKRLVHGQRLRLEGLEDGPAIAHWHGALLAVCDAEDGVLRPRRVFPPPEESGS
jgi:tRNA pseudouridine55 synthase